MWKMLNFQVISADRFKQGMIFQPVDESENEDVC